MEGDVGVQQLIAIVACCVVVGVQLLDVGDLAVGRPDRSQTDREALQSDTHFEQVRHGEAPVHDQTAGAVGIGDRRAPHVPADPPLHLDNAARLQTL